MTVTLIADDGSEDLQCFRD